MKIYTWVCKDCCAGWDGTLFDRICRWCGQPGECRGSYEEVPLPLRKVT